MKNTENKIIIHKIYGNVFYYLYFRVYSTKQYDHLLVRRPPYVQHSDCSILNDLRESPLQGLLKYHKITKYHLNYVHLN